MKLRYPVTAALVAIIFTSGFYTHKAWVFGHEIARQASACQRTQCLEHERMVQILEEDTPIGTALPPSPPKMKKKG